MSDHNIDCPIEYKNYTYLTGDVYGHRTQLEKIMDALYSLSHSFDVENEFSGIGTFLRAYLTSGTIPRAKSERRDTTEDIYAGIFLLNQLASPELPANLMMICSQPCLNSLGIYTLQMPKRCLSMPSLRTSILGLLLRGMDSPAELPSR